MEKFAFVAHDGFDRAWKKKQEQFFGLLLNDISYKFLNVLSITFLKSPQHGFKPITPKRALFIPENIVVGEYYGVF